MSHKYSQKEVQEWFDNSGSVLYTNGDDRNIIVKKEEGFPYTINLANPILYIIAIILIFIIAYFK